MDLKAKLEELKINRGSLVEITFREGVRFNMKEPNFPRAEEGFDYPVNKPGKKVAGYVSAIGEETLYASKHYYDYLDIMPSKRVGHI